MSWNYRIVKTKLNEEEDTYDVCEVYYDKEGNPVSYALNKNVLSQDTFEDLLWTYKEIEKAYQKPILVNEGGRLIELSVCPKCGRNIGYDTMDLMGDGVEKDFGKTVLFCSKSKDCDGYMAVRQDYK